MNPIDNAALVFLSVYALAIITPGPNFMLVSNAALGHMRLYGLAAAFGIATGSYLFSLAGIFGLLLLISSWAPMESVLRFVGGGYLLWIGISMLKRLRSTPVNPGGGMHVNLSVSEAYCRGLTTNLTNPKAWAFYLSLFTLLGSPEYSFAGKNLLAFTMFFISLSWYSVVVLVLSSASNKIFAQRTQAFVQGTLGVVLIAMASRILFGY